MADDIATASPWTPEGIAFLRRVEAGEVYTGESGTALARWAVGLNNHPLHRPYDRGDLARCMNVYWSAPKSLQDAMRDQITTWADMLKREAKGKPSWRWMQPDFSTPRYYRREDSLDDYWGFA